MKKMILITGSTDGIGYATAQKCLLLGHNVIIHGRNEEKVARAKQNLLASTGKAVHDTYMCDISLIKNVHGFAKDVLKKYAKIDVLINNAGVFVVPAPFIIDGLDVRFVVNALAPYLLTKELLPLMDSQSRVINLSSAAQSKVDMVAMQGQKRLQDGNAYAQSKLALTMWSIYMGRALKDKGPVVIAVNPKSFLGTKMVKVAYGRRGYDIGIGADILVRAALGPEFADATGMYFDNDIEEFTQPHPDALDMKKCAQLIEAMEQCIIARLGHDDIEHHQKTLSY